MPGSEGSGELFFGHLVQGAGKPAQLLRRLALRPAGEILRNRLHLVELAELHRDVLALKNPCHASPAVDDGCGNGPAALQESPRGFGRTPMSSPARLRSSTDSSSATASETRTRHRRGQGT